MSHICPTCGQPVGCLQQLVHDLNTPLGEIVNPPADDPEPIGLALDLIRTGLTHVQYEEAKAAVARGPGETSATPCICRSVATLQARPDCPVHGMRQEPGPMPSFQEFDCHKCANGRHVMYMILCPTCGNKRCPKASDHELACTNSNATGQPGSIY